MTPRPIHHQARVFGVFFPLLIFIFLAFLQPALGAPRKQKTPPPAPTKGLDVAQQLNAKELTEASANGLRVMILCDSMGMSGFAEQLDACFRSCPGVASVHTFAACGSNPLTWMKMAPHANATTRCGYLRMETKIQDSGIRVEKEFKGMIKRGAKGQRVPKIEDLIPTIKPDILIIQNGNNFFGNFNSRRPISDTQGKVIRGHVSPMIKWLIAKADTTRKLYWVTPPQAGNISPEAQQFIYDSIHSEVQGVGTMIDSRTLTSFPYPSQSRDKMHFSGKAATDWGTSTFRIIASDIANTPIASLPALTSLRPQENPTAEKAEPTKPADASKSDNQIALRVRLKKSTIVPKPESFAPYGEFLTTNLYTVTRVIKGEYKEKEIAIMHPAYIKHRKQNLSRLKKKRNLTISVTEPPEDSPWITVNRSDTVASPEHTIYMLTEDLKRHPENEDCLDCDNQQTTSDH
jgi:hypothetical protein